MIQFRENTVVWDLLRMIALCGEFPVYSTGLIGNRRECRKRICQMQTEQTYRNSRTGEKLTVRALTVSSNGRLKTVRLTRNGAELLKWTGDYATYADRFMTGYFKSDKEHIDRNHRIAETAAVFMRAGFHVESDRNADMTQSDDAVFYLPHIFKSSGYETDRKSLYTRITGGFRTPFDCFTVYNTRNRAMIWYGNSETKSALLLGEKAGLEVTGSIMLGRDYATGLRTAFNTESAGSRTRFYEMHRRLYFIPLDTNGIELLRLVAQRDFSERVLELMFDPGTRAYDRGTFNYHARIRGVYVYSFLDSDLKGLINYRNGIHSDYQTEILCYDFQTDFVNEYFSGTGTRITRVPFDAVKNNLS